MAQRSTSVFRGWFPSLALLALAALQAGCGDSGETEGVGGGAGARSVVDDSTASGFGGAWAGAVAPALETEVVGTTGKAFEPEGIQLQYVGTSPNYGLELVSFTLHQSLGTFEEVAWVFAVKNTGSEVVCQISVPATFYDAAGTELARDNFGESLFAPMYVQGGEPEACLGPGEVGMAEQTLGLDELIVADVARIDHAFVGIVDSTATPLKGVEVQNLEVVPRYGEYGIDGDLYNGWSSTFQAPQVAIFVVDPIGRPIAEMFDIDLTLVTAGSAWSFQTLTYAESPENYVVYYDFHEPY